MHTEQGGFDP